MITHGVRVVSSTGNNVDITCIGEFVLKDFEHLLKHDDHRRVSSICVICDSIEVDRERDEYNYVKVTATVGKTRRVFHFYNVLLTEVDVMEEE